MRTTLWQELDSDLEKLTTNISLRGFQRDLACLRQLCQHIPVSFFFLIIKNIHHL